MYNSVDHGSGVLGEVYESDLGANEDTVAVLTEQFEAALPQ